jgi:hypothetical protein
MTKAQHMWPDAERIEGNGEWATVSHCPPGIMVKLHRTRAAAWSTKASIDEMGCCSHCVKQHEIVFIGEGPPAAA